MQQHKETKVRNEKQYTQNTKLKENVTNNFYHKKLKKKIVLLFGLRTSRPTLQIRDKPIKHMPKLKSRCFI